MHPVVDLRPVDLPVVVVGSSVVDSDAVDCQLSAAIAVTCAATQLLW